MSNWLLLLYVLTLLFMRDGLREAAIIILTIVSAVVVIRRVWATVRRIRVHIYLQPLETEQVQEPVRKRRPKKLTIRSGRRRLERERGWSDSDWDNIPEYTEPELILPEAIEPVRVADVGRRTRRRAS